MRLNYVEKQLSTLFSKYIGIVICYPLAFFVIPIILTAFLCLGILRYSEAFIKDDILLYTPTNARARQELKELDELFYINDSSPYYAARRYDVKRTGFVIVTNENEEEDVLNPLVFQAAMHLWSVIQSFTIEDLYEKQIDYPSLCVKFPMSPEMSGLMKNVFTNFSSVEEQFCVSNPIVDMFKLLLTTEDYHNSISKLLSETLDEFSLKRLNDVIPLESTSLMSLLGGVAYEGQKISGAKAIMLPYALKHATSEEDKLAEKWELKLADYLLSFQSPVIRTSWWTYETLASEAKRDRDQLKNMLIPCFLTVSLYTIAVCCVFSWSHSRPWLALGGVVSSAMSIISSVGLLLLLQFKITSIVYAMPFIIFSVGVDNIFIILSSWRATSSEKSLDIRMSEIFSDAGVSITITSLTDLMSFGIGCLTPFPSVQIFCVYASVAVLFTYVYQLTFFISILYVTCAREMQHRNCVTMRKMKTSHEFNGPHKSEADVFSSILLATMFNQNHMFARFFYTRYTTLLLDSRAQIWILTAFTIYLVTACLGCTKLRLGLEPNNLLPDTSYGKESLELSEKYFPDHGCHLHVWMRNLSTIDLGNRRLWIVLNKEIQLYEHTEFTTSADSWLDVFLDYTHNKSGSYLAQDNFITLLKEFLSRPEFDKYNKDVILTSNMSQLEASRITVRLRYVGFENQTRAMHLFRRLADTGELTTKVFADFFLFAEQYDAIFPNTVSSILVAGGAVILVSLLLIPDPLAAFWVSFTIISINIGVLGFMSFLSVKLDFVSMITIVMSIGFCVDFNSHLAYNFVRGQNIDSTRRLRNALYIVGTPILQSASSTIIGVSFIASAESYIFRSFLKTMILVITLATIHGIVFLPVFLTILHKNKGTISCQNNSSSELKVCRITAEHISLPIQLLNVNTIRPTSHYTDINNALYL
ncbi:patched family domain-containing protein [Ditylenchus destructor]|uniref:Patched family domain-containing protein n=1 Tax=Ditylenchus destructor TaxID=166010 RepID=A0AAD4R3H2_9BILA|nr:patched family domain-containing protein [Ditylenchus destructor]